MDTKNIQLIEMERIYGKVSPFELKNNLLKLAENESRKSSHILLDAGRGNPNWTAVSAREAFFALGQFSAHIARNSWKNVDETLCGLGGMPEMDGIYEKFNAYFAKHMDMPGADLLVKIVNYGISSMGFDPQSWIHELADGIMGDNYPLPVRMLPHVETVVKKYLGTEIYMNGAPQDFDLFGVEGATAGMCYIFDSLIANNLLLQGDTIAIMTPIFTPYLEIPLIPRYNFNIININASEEDWQYPDSEIEKIGDKKIKALFLVNPSNPPSVAMNQHVINKLCDTVKKRNPNLMIISDDVYGTFTDNFKSAASALPSNTIGVYSFSKYFGVTGWRLGTIRICKENVFDRLLKNLPVKLSASAKKRYEALSTNPENIKFIDRLAADSRQVALNHTAGLSTPQQVQMAIFSIFSLIDSTNFYKNLVKQICRRRKALLYKSLEIAPDVNPLSASYYTEFNILHLAEKFYGAEFAKYMKNNSKPIDILFSLANKSSIVLLSGAGFKGPLWSIRISLANLDDESYTKIGKTIRDILDQYAEKWKNHQKALL